MPKDIQELELSVAQVDTTCTDIYPEKSPENTEKPPIEPEENIIRILKDEELPTELDDSVEAQFSPEIRILRKRMFQTLIMSEINSNEVFHIGNIKKVKNSKSSRASQYRGVSANGPKW